MKHDSQYLRIGSALVRREGGMGMRNDGCNERREERGMLEMGVATVVVLCTFTLNQSKTLR